MVKVLARQNQTRNNSVDIIRILAALLVVYIHIHTIGVNFIPGSFSSMLDSLLYGVSRLAVPMFFAISGWFLFDPSRERRIERLSKQIPKLIKLYLIAFVGTVLAYEFITKIFPGFPMGEGLVPFPTTRDVFNIVFVGSGGGVLWYISSLIIIEIIYYFVFRVTKNENWMMPVSAIGLVLVLLTVSYTSVTGWSWGVHPESWYVGISYFSIGYFLKKFYDSMFLQVKTKSIVVFTVTSAILYAYEYILHTSGKALAIGPSNYLTDFIMLPFVVAGILLLTTRVQGKSRLSKFMGMAGQKYSLIIYIVHSIVISGILFGIYANLHLLGNHQAIRLGSAYVITIAVSFALAIAYTNAKERVNRRKSK